MTNKQLNIQFCGFGGQGIILLAVVFGTTAVTKAGLNAVQTQSYGSEARGGECQAEVIVSPDRIASPLADSKDLLVAMSQSALDKYLPGLEENGYLFYDPELITSLDRDDIHVYQVPATRMAGDLGVKLAANMVMLGYMHQALALTSEDLLLEVVKDNVPAKFVEVNLEAVKQGMELARMHKVRLEV